MKAKAFFGNIIIAFLSALLGIIVYEKYFQDELAKPENNEQVKQNTLKLLEDSNKVNYIPLPRAEEGGIADFTLAAEKSVNAVVHVTSKYNLESDYYSRNPILDLLFGDGYTQQPSVSFGSGVIISEDGYIVTNYHVIEKSNEIQVVLNDKRTYTAKLVGKDPSTDLALLKVDADKLPYIPLGDSDNLKVGEWVLAVGNPFNLTSTVTAGIVSAKARSINILQGQNYSIESYIQTDAAVNKGNSGGALVNLYGELVGINSAILSPSGAYSGYSFAIPVNLVKKIVADIIKYGEVQRAMLGVTIREVTADDAEKYNLDKIEGVRIEELSEAGAAKASGLKTGDVILEINNVGVNSNAELTEQIAKYRPGELIYVTVKRDNKKKQFEVILRNMQGTTSIIKADDYLNFLGASFKELNNSDKRSFGVGNGVMITELKDGILKKQGIKEGFVITAVDGKKIHNTDDLKQVIQNAAKGSILEFEVTYAGSRYIYVYRIKLE